MEVKDWKESVCVYEIPLGSPSEVNKLSEINWVGGGLVLDGGVFFWCWIFWVFTSLHILCLL